MKQRKSIRRRMAALLLAGVLLCSACGQTARATTMHLTRSEGSVAVADGEGADVALAEQLGLYDGYQVNTRAASYAWIDLDSVKLTKMDADSEIGIHKDGKALEIQVRSGGLFFNVTEPLAEDESMDIRTSNMVVGIRGTCGWVKVENENHMWVYLLEGTVECSILDDEGKVLTSDTVSAGERAEMTRDENGECRITVGEYDRSELPDFVLPEAEAAAAETPAQPGSTSGAGTADDGARTEAIRGMLDRLTEREQERVRQEEEQKRVEEADRQRRAALLEILNGLSEEEAMYARLGDLNGDGLEDVLTLGRCDFGAMGSGFAFGGIVWDGVTAQRMIFNRYENLNLFAGSDSYVVYREKATGMLYAGYALSMDAVVSRGFENALDSVELGFTWAYESESGEAEWNEKYPQLTAQIDERFEVVDELIPVMYENWFDWWMYWNADGPRPGLPAFYSSVEEVRSQLAAGIDELQGETGQEPPEAGTEPGTGDGQLPLPAESMDFSFSSGAGAWGTGMTVHADGSFEGDYHDSNMGETGDGYDASVYVCSFRGRFENIVKVNDYTWSMTLGSMELDEEPGREWIEDRVRYIASDPYGMEGGTEFIFYTPEAPASELTEDFLSWMLFTGSMAQPGEPLGLYGIYNRDMGYGFFGY